MKYFVTGTTGFVGGHVARQLVEAGHEVVAVVRNPAKAGDLKNLGVQIYQGDVTEKESMRGPMTGVDGVFHIAGWYKIGLKDKSEGAKINIAGKHISEYDRTKWVAHYEVAEPMIAEGLPLVVVMPGLIYGPGDTSSVRTTFLHYLQRKLPLQPTKTAFSWAHVNDIARGHILAMEQGKAGECYIIAGPTIEKA